MNHQKNQFGGRKFGGTYTHACGDHARIQNYNNGTHCGCMTNYGFNHVNFVRNVAHVRLFSSRVHEFLNQEKFYLLKLSPHIPCINIYRLHNDIAIPSLVYVINFAGIPNQQAAGLYYQIRSVYVAICRRIDNWDTQRRR